MTLGRGKPLERRTPLKRGKPLQARHSLSDGPRTPLARTGRLKPVSNRQRAENAAKPEVRAAVFERDGHRCRIRPLIVEAGYAEWARCYGVLTPHHLRKDGQGGAYSIENLISACAYHNGWVEDHPVEAKGLGLVL